MSTHTALSHRTRLWGRGTLSVVAGFAVIAALSYATDYVFEATGTLPYDSLNVAWPLVLLVVVYRLGYSVLGCYVAARLAPDRPTVHALALGVLGVVLSSVGAAVTWNMNLGPAWYSLSLIAGALPCALLGGKLFELGNREQLHR